MGVLGHVARPYAIHGVVLIEDVATGERRRVAADFDAEVGQEVVVQGRRWVVVE